MSVSFDYTGKLVLITGSTLGIGRAIAEQYIISKANVIINGRKKNDVDKIVETLKTKYNVDNKNNGNKEEKEKENDKQNVNSNQKIYGIAADLSNAKECDKLVEEINKIGHLDILINNVGIYGVKNFEDITDDEWLNIYNINVLSGVRLCRAFLPLMLERVDKNSDKRKGGNIVMISSECGVRPIPHMVHYSMTKACQISIARGLAELTKGVEGVRVNSLLPGPTWTEGVQEYLQGFCKEKNIATLEEGMVEYFKTYEPTSLKQKFQPTIEIANACLFLTSDGASGTNGAALLCEGGIVRHM